MGLSLSWIALAGASAEDIAARARLTFKAPAKTRAPRFWIGTLDGWSVIVAEDNGYPSRERLEHLSRNGGLALGVQVEEHVMVSTIQLWRDGARTWALLHDPDRPEAENYAHEGEPPAEFDRLRRRAFARQRGDDGVDHLFDLPSEVSKALCGFDPNQIPWDEDERFRPAYRAAASGDALDGDTEAEWRAFAADRKPRRRAPPPPAPSQAADRSVERWEGMSRWAAAPIGLLTLSWLSFASRHVVSPLREIVLIVGCVAFLAAFFVIVATPRSWGLKAQAPVLIALGVTIVLGPAVGFESSLVQFAWLGLLSGVFALGATLRLRRLMSRV